MTSLDLSSFDTPKLKTMNNMFEGCENLSFLDMSNFDARIVEDFSNAFSGLPNQGKIIYDSNKFTSNIMNILPKDWEKSDINN